MKSTRSSAQSARTSIDSVYGFYKPCNVKLHSELLQKHQKYVKEKINVKSDEPVYLDFHVVSPSTKQEYNDTISYGVVKLNLDTNLQ